MGAIVSSLGIAFKTLRNLNSRYMAILERVNGSPGKPVANPTPSVWQQPPSLLASHASETPPDEVDVLIIGSGITACSIAYHLLRSSDSTARRTPRVAIFEARELCSGATGRNGGHIKETPYLEWATLLNRFGRGAADEVVRFRMAHLKQLLELAEKEGITVAAEAREVETVDVFCEAETWHDAQQKLRNWLEAFPDEKGHWKVWEGDDLKTKFALTAAKGAITGPAGALAPYTLITELYSKLLREFPTLSIECNTPIETLHGTPVDPWRRPLTPLQPYTCFTFQGKSRTIKATHVIHATNGHVTRLVPGLKGRIIPLRGQMTAQRLFPGNVALPGGSNRSWSFIWNKGFDYMTCREDGTYMLGGGWARGSNEGIDALGNATDDENTIYETAYLGGLLPALFPSLVQGVTVEQAWTGTLGFSVDSLPWVGPIPERVAGGRKKGTGSEWICAGYSGEGMVNAWGCGQGVAAMVRNQMYGENAVIGIPSVMLITEKRVKTASFEMLAEDYML